MAIQIFEENLVKIFILVLNMTLTGSVVILAVLLARLFLRKAPGVFSYALWAVVLIRLLCPVSFSLPVSFLGLLQNEPAREGRMEYIAEDIGYMEKPQIALPAPGLSGMVNDALPLADRTASVNPMQIYLIIGAYIWLLGMLSMAVYSVISLVQFQRKLREAVFEKENIYRIKGGGSPFVCGLFRPRIYLPEKMTEEEEKYILLHEQIHIKRGDAVARLLAYLALCLHWFNPLVWAAFAFSGRDMEMACDEAVIRRLGSGVKKEYSASLLNVAAGRRIVKGIFLAFGESDTGSRIKNILRYRKPAAFFAGGAALVSTALAVMLLANPAKAKENENIFYGVVTEAETFLSEFGFGITVNLVKSPESQDGGAESADVSAPADAMQEDGTALYADRFSGDTEIDFSRYSPELLENRELPDGRYVVYVRSISRSARGFDLYVTDAETEDLPLFPFADDCEFRVNWEKDTVSYSPVSFDKFADLVTQSVRVINPTVYCEVVNSQIVRADIESGYYMNGFTYAGPVGSGWELYAGNAANNLSRTEEEVLEQYYSAAGTETADISDATGEEQIEIYTGNIGDGESGAVLFKNAEGKVLGSEFAHVSRAGWNNIYIGKAEGTGYILTVHVEDRDTYGGYEYHVYRLGEAGEIRQIAGSRFDFGGNRRYDDEMFHVWADNLAYYLKNSHLVLSSQDGEIRTERVSEADRYNYETLRRGL